MVYRVEFQDSWDYKENPVGGQGWGVGDNNYRYMRKNKFEKKLKVATKVSKDLPNLQRHPDMLTVVG